MGIKLAKIIFRDNYLEIKKFALGLITSVLFELSTPNYEGLKKY